MKHHERLKDVPRQVEFNMFSFQGILSPHNQMEFEKKLDFKETASTSVIIAIIYIFIYALINH